MMDREKQRARFRKNSAKYKAKMTPEQRESHRTYIREYARTPKARASRKARRHKYEPYNRARKYGLKPDDVHFMWINQLCACPICGENIPDPRKAHIDHDHRTDKIRGLLCRDCNIGLGMFKDSPESMARGAAYLCQQAQLV